MEWAHPNIQYIESGRAVLAMVDYSRFSNIEDSDDEPIWQSQVGTCCRFKSHQPLVHFE